MRTDNWYVLQVRTGRELPVAEAARKLDGVAAFVPIETIIERQENEFAERQRLIYPSYVFVQTERLHAQRYYEFKRLDGVIRLLGLAGGDIPRAVPEEEMAVLLELVGDAETIGVSHGVKNSGGRVDIIDGPLLGLKGCVPYALRNGIYLGHIKVIAAVNRHQGEELVISNHVRDLAVLLREHGGVNVA